jgi:hypothetical protein
MTNSFDNISLQKTARVAGLWYLLMAITASVGLLMVPSKIISVGNPAITAQNIIDNEQLFRVGILGNILCQISFIFLVLALNRLFKGVDEKQSKLMVSLVIAAVPTAFLIELTQIAALYLLSGAEYLKVFNPDQLNVVTAIFLNIHEQGIIIVGIFWGLWLFPFGYLAIKSGFIPKIFGILLIINCFAYLIDSFTAILNPQFRELISPFLMLPLAVGEISTILWLLIKGVKDQKQNSVRIS